MNPFSLTFSISRCMFSTRSSYQEQPQISFCLETCYMLDMYQLYSMQSLPKLVVRITIRILKNLVLTNPCSFLYYRDGWNENIWMALFELIFVSGALIIVNIKTFAGLKTHLIRKKKNNSRGCPRWPIAALCRRIAVVKLSK